MIPDMTNPRFSYGGGKIASELLTLHYGGTRGLETVIFRPHNIYGANMGFEHVIPELVAKIVKLSDNLTKKSIDLPIQGSGEETRAFCYMYVAFYYVVKKEKREKSIILVLKKKPVYVN